MANRFAVALLLGVLALSPGFVAAEDAEGSLEQVVIEEAQTPAQHEALAKFYRAEASEARTQARRHQAMAQAYMAAKRGNKQGARNHCNRISEQQEAIAKEYEALAKMHEELAKSPQ